MKVIKAFKYRIYPTKEQEVLLAKHFGTKRFVWNYFLNQRKEAYLTNKKTLTYNANAVELTKLKKQEGFAWLKEVNSQTAQAALMDLDVAYHRFFNKIAEFPQFKSKQDRQSFRVPQYTYYADEKLDIPKFKQPIKVREDRPLTGEILFSTVSKSTTGKYYVSITCETEHTPHKEATKQVGIDLGIKELAICSNGTHYPNAKTTKKYAKKLTYEQRQLSRKEKGSKNRNRQRHKVAMVHEKIANVRQNHIHKITTQLVRENQTICVEDLAVANMAKNHKLSKSIFDCAWGEFLRQLDYKSNWNNRNLVQIDRFFPSSKTCNKCKYIKHDLSLEDREWICQNCGAELDRDINAAENILEQGLIIYSGCGTQSELKQKRGEASGDKTSLRSAKPRHL